MISRNKNIIKTPFGIIQNEVGLFPIIYLFIIHLSGLLPWKLYNEKKIFELWSRHEYLAEHFQFIFYISAAIITLIIIFKNKYKLRSYQNLYWIILMISLFVISFEEISYINKIEIDFFDFIRSNNAQNEVNFHNSDFFHPFLHAGFIFLNLFLGWFGWRNLSFIEAIPSKIYSLYFLFPALAFTIFELKNYIPSVLFSKLPVQLENYEFLMALALFLHTLKSLKKYLKMN